MREIHRYMVLTHEKQQWVDLHLQPTIRYQAHVNFPLPKRYPINNVHNQSNEYNDLVTQCHQSLNFLHKTVTQVSRVSAIRVTGGIAYRKDELEVILQMNITK